MTMNKAFRMLLNKCAIVYLDDILIYSPDGAQHLQDIKAVSKILSENRLRTKASKCEFLQGRLEFLGHIISADGVEIDPKKIATIQAWHAPTNLTEMQSFLGFVDYVRRFVPDMAKLNAPLTDLQKKRLSTRGGRKSKLPSEPSIKFCARRPYYTSLIHTARSNCSLMQATSSCEQYCCRNLGTDFNQSRTSPASFTRSNATTRYTTARCWRSCMRSKCGNATSPEQTCQHGQTTDHYSTFAPNQISIRGISAGWTTWSPTSTTPSRTKRGHRILPTHSPAPLPNFTPSYLPKPTHC
ncbi:unnamed protein product [Closterium sp. NIES-54]